MNKTSETIAKPYSRSVAHTMANLGKSKLERKARLRMEANQRDAKWRQLDDSVKLSILTLRPGSSQRQRDRLQPKRKPRRAKSATTA